MQRRSLDIYYFDKDVVANLRQSLDLLPEEVPYLYEGGVDFLLDSVHDLHEDLEYHDAVIAKAAYLFWNLVKGHYFVGGNKRTALLTTHMFLNYNGLFLRIRKGEGYLTCLRILHALIDEKGLRDWIKDNIVYET